MPPASILEASLRASKWALVAIVSCSALLGQSATDAARSSLVHISGTVSQCGKAFPRIPVRFTGNTSQIARTNSAGVYEIDLPVGVWTASTPPSPTDPAERSLSRPRSFRLTSAGSLVLNIYLRPPVACDVVMATPGGRPPTPEEINDRDAGCFGEKFFPAPAVDGAPFEVNLFGLITSIGDACSAEPSGQKHRQFATYNLLSIEADEVAYDPLERILKASGNVVIHDQRGERHTRLAKFEIRDGEVITAR
jgi:hypothetical protein